MSGWIIDRVLIVIGIGAGAWVPLNIDIIANQIFTRNIDMLTGNETCTLSAAWLSL